MNKLLPGRGRTPLASGSTRQIASAVTAAALSEPALSLTEVVEPARQYPQASAASAAAARGAAHASHSRAPKTTLATIIFLSRAARNSGASFPCIWAAPD